MNEYGPNVYRPRATNQQITEQKFTVQQAAKFLGVSRMTIYRLTSEIGGAPQLRHYRIGPGRVIRIPVSAIREYLGEADTGSVS